MVGTMDEEVPALSGPPVVTGPPKRIENEPVQVPDAAPASAPSAAGEKEKKSVIHGDYESTLAWTADKDGVAPCDSLYNPL